MFADSVNLSEVCNDGSAYADGSHLTVVSSSVCRCRMEFTYGVHLQRTHLHLTFPVLSLYSSPSSTFNIWQRQTREREAEIVL